MSLTMGSWVFLQPLWLLPAAILLVASLLFHNRKNKSAWARVLAPEVLEFLGGDQSHRVVLNIALVSGFVIAVSLSQPALRQSDDNTWRHSTGWVVVADVSRSMTLSDVVPSRLSALRDTLATLSGMAGARPISLILYSGDAFLVAPPAFDRSVFNEHAALLEHGVIPIEGSNLARALSLTSSVIEGSQFIQARVLLLTDTGGIGKSSIAAAGFLAQSGHRLDVLSFGFSGSSTTQSVETSVDMDAARSLAKAGKGLVVSANRFGVLDFSDLELDHESDPSTHSDLRSLVWRLQSQWILLLALPLLLMLFKEEVEA